jgi:hypothetical protein
MFANNDVRITKQHHMRKSMKLEFKRKESKTAKLRRLTTGG